MRRDAADHLDAPDFEAWVARECGCEARAAAVIKSWLVKAGEVLQGVPDDQGLVVESFCDEMGGRHAVIHSVFGMRINGAWGMALREQVRRRFGLQAEASHVDDGILLSFAPGQVPPRPSASSRSSGPTTSAFAAFVEAGFSVDGPRLSWDGYPGPARRADVSGPRASRRMSGRRLPFCA